MFTKAILNNTEFKDEEVPPISVTYGFNKKSHNHIYKMWKLQHCDSIDCAIKYANRMDGLPTTWTFADDSEIGYAVSGSFPRRSE
jgi:acyl-homoserine lactone acylase PvdQ